MSPPVPMETLPSTAERAAIHLRDAYELLVEILQQEVVDAADILHIRFAADPIWDVLHAYLSDARRRRRLH